MMAQEKLCTDVNSEVTSSNSHPSVVGRRLVSFCSLLVAVIAVALALWIQFASPIDPFPSFVVDSVEIPPPDEMDPLRAAQHILQNLSAPEDGVALEGDEWIWSLGNGELRHVNMRTMISTKFAQTGQSHELCGKLSMEEHCGRPLGLLKLPIEDRARYQQYVPELVHTQKPLLLVADAYKGLLLVLSGGEVVTLLTKVEDKSLYFANAIARAQNGIIYLSDTSSRFRRNQVLLESLEAQPSGRVISWDPDTGTSRVVADQLAFPNGLILQNDDQSLLIASTTRHQILKVDLEDASAPPQIFAALPGLPDNLHVSYVEEWKRSVLWVGLSTKATIITHWLNSLPQLRKALAMLPPNLILKCIKRYGLLLALDAESGQILRSYQDPEGRTAYIAGIHFDNKYGYIGSWKNHFLARIPTDKLFSVELEK